MKIKLIIIYSILFLSCQNDHELSCKSMNDTQTKISWNEYMLQTEFSSLIKELIQLNPENIDVDNAIAILRCYNTILEYNLKDSLSHNFKFTVNNKFKDKIISILEMKNTRSEIISLKYNIVFGNHEVPPKYHIEFLDEEK